MTLPEHQIARSSICFILAATAFVWPGQPSQAQRPADLVLTNGRLLTVDARDSIVQAIAVTGGKIVAVGSNDGIKLHIGGATRIIDLRGRTATPGLIDTHVHFSAAASLYTIDLGDPTIKTIDAVLARVRDRVRT